MLPIPGTSSSPASRRERRRRFDVRRPALTHSCRGTQAQARRRSPHPRRPSVGLQQRSRHCRHAADTRSQPGAAVQVHSSRDEFLGHAYVNPHALICARIVGRDPEQPLGRRRSSCIGCDVALRLARAAVRASRITGWCSANPTGLPGLVLDRYGDVVVGQIATAGMEALQAARSRRRCATWSNPTRSVLEKRFLRARARASAATSRKLAFGDVPRRARGASKPACSFVAPLRDGQKTGWFYDQTANRERLLRYLPPGARVLDVCSYVGAWAVTALKNGAQPRDVRRLLRAGADLRRAQRRAQRRCARDAARRRLRCPEAAAGAGRALRRRDPRSARLHQAQERHSAGPGRLSQAQPARAQPHRGRRPAGVLLVLLSPGARTIWPPPSRARRATPAVSCRFSRWAGSRPTIRCIRRSPKRAT